METSQFYYFAASDYSCDAYGAGKYSQCSTTTSSGSGSSSGGLLADTGYAVLIPVALAVAIAGAAAILLVKRWIEHKRSKKSGGEPKDLV